MKESQSLEAWHIKNIRCILQIESRLGSNGHSTMAVSAGPAASIATPLVGYRSPKTHMCFSPTIVIMRLTQHPRPSDCQFRTEQDSFPISTLNAGINVTMVREWASYQRLVIVVNRWGQFLKAASWGLLDGISSTLPSQAAREKFNQLDREKDRVDPHRTAPLIAPTSSCGPVGTFRSESHNVS